jgi:cephalosporin-C deacetylase-like acetyl esterase
MVINPIFLIYTCFHKPLNWKTFYGFITWSETLEGFMDGKITSKSFVFYCYFLQCITYLQSWTNLVDPERIGIWGTSYSGGHVLVVTAIDKRVKCVVSQMPSINGK